MASLMTLMFFKDLKKLKLFLSEIFHRGPQYVLNRTALLEVGTCCFYLLNLPLTFFWLLRHL